MKRFFKNIRLWVQLTFTALSNGYVQGFLGKKLYQGNLKQICLPGLNCYSCPGALGSCPIGALQAVLSSRSYKFSFYVLGFLLLTGVLVGRFVCGFLCPFGLVQDLLNKIPFPKKLRRFPGDRWLRYGKYIVLIVFVIVLPLTVLDIVGQGAPWFCTWICPSGTLMGGLPQLAMSSELRAGLGFLFNWKLGILLIILALSIVIPRPFCRYLCPLGAIYGLLNPLSLYRLECDKTKCVGCGGCKNTCPMDVDPVKTPNHPECIRCGQCKSVCAYEALKGGFRSKKTR